MAVVVGTVYVLTNGVGNLIFGALADMYPRKYLWLITCLVWTACTFLESYAQNFTQLLIARMGFALVMGSSVPLCVSLLSDFTMPSERGLAQSLYASGLYIGYGMASLSILINERFGWRETVRIVCFVSWACVIPMFFVPEPVRNETNRLAQEAKQARSQLFEVDPSVKTFGARMCFLVKNSCYRYLLFAVFFRGFSGACIGFLSGQFFEQRYPDNLTQFSYMNTVVVIGGGLPAVVIGGWISDRFESKIGSIKGIIAGIGALISTPFIIGAFVVQPDNFWVAITLYYFAFFTAEAWYGPAHAQINNMFPSEFQGFAVAVFNFISACGGSVATLTLGALKTRFEREDDPDFNHALNGYLMAAGVCTGYLICGPLFLVSGAKYSNQMKQVRAKLMLKNEPIQ